MGIDGLSTMHANAAASNAVIFPGPGNSSQYKVNENLKLNATMPSILMTENGALVCVGVGTTAETASTPIVMLISPKTLEPLDQEILIKPEIGNLAGGLYNYIDNNDRLVLVNGSGDLQWYSNNYNPIKDTGNLTLEKSISIGQPLVVGLVPDYQGRIWFATQGSLSTSGPQAVVGFYDKSTNQTQTYTLPAGEMVGNSISSSPAGVAVATTSALYLFSADNQNSIQNNWHTTYENSGVRKPGQLTPGTGSTPVFFGPNTGYEYLVITDNATAPGSNNITPAEHVNIYNVNNGNLFAQTSFLNSNNSGTENAPIAIGNHIFVPSTYGYWYPPPSETPSDSVPTLAQAPFAGGLQAMSLDGSDLTTNWGNGNTIPSSALPRLSMADNLIYTIIANSVENGGGLNSSTTVQYSFAVINAGNGEIVGTPYSLGSNTFSGNAPNYINTSSYTWNTLQMTGVISPAGVFYQGTAGGLFSIEGVAKNTILNNAELYITQLYQDILKRSGDSVGIAYWVQELESGASSRAEVAYQFLTSREFDNNISSIAHIYVGSLDRLPDTIGLKYWIDQNQTGSSFQQISNALLNSYEYTHKYGTPDLGRYINILYENILNRAPDTEGLSFWQQQAHSGISRDEIMLQFLGGEEFKRNIEPQIQLKLDIMCLTGKNPDVTTGNNWIMQIDEGTSEVSLIAQILQSYDYINRFIG